MLALIVGGMALAAGTKGVAGFLAGVPLYNPPFLMARVVADGPGRRFLEQACVTRRFAMCAFLDRPLDNSEEILSSDDPARGVFYPADYGIKVRLIEEQLDVVLGTVQADPWGVAGSTVADIAKLAQRMRLAPELDWNMPLNLYGLFDDFTPGTAALYQAIAAVRDTLPFGLIDGWFAAVALSSVAMLALIAFLAPVWLHRVQIEAEDRRSVLIFSAGLVGAVVANLMVCAALSGAHDRYHARIIWPVPFTAAVVWWTFGPFAHKRIAQPIGAIERAPG